MTRSPDWSVEEIACSPTAYGVSHTDSIEIVFNQIQSAVAHRKTAPQINRICASEECHRGLGIPNRHSVQRREKWKKIGLIEFTPS